MERVKYWEIIADNLKKAGWSLGVSFGLRGANNLDCRRASPATESGSLCVWMKS